MSLAELTEGLGSQKPKKEAPIDKIDFDNVLAGEVAEDGEIKLDTTDLDAIGARLREVRKKAAKLKKEDERLRKLILAHPDAKAGYSNSSVKIEGVPTIDITSPELLGALLDSKTLGEACNLSISVPKVRAIAERIKQVADAVEASMLTARKVKIQK